MKSSVTSKFQTTMPKSIREKLQISIGDSLEWEIEDSKVVVYPVLKNFLDYRNSIPVGKGDTKQDIEHSRTKRAENFIRRGLSLNR
jgi:AbrB family looped-hinge helix DNA binding protein